MTLVIAQDGCSLTDHNIQGREKENIVANRSTPEADSSHEWKGVKLFSLSRVTYRLPNETMKQFRARVDRNRHIQRERMAARRSGDDHTTKDSAKSASVVSGARSSDGKAGAIPTVASMENGERDRSHESDHSERDHFGASLIGSVCSAPASSMLSFSAIHDDVPSVDCDHQLALVHHQNSPPLKGGEVLGGVVDKQTGSQRDQGEQRSQTETARLSSDGPGETKVLAIDHADVYDALHALRTVVQDLQRRLDEALVERTQISSQLAWAKANFPELLHRLGTVEQELGCVQPPRKPWLPPMPEALHDREVAAQRLRDSLDPTLRSMADYEEGRWPYCGWHLAVAHVRNKGVPLTLSLEPRDKMALDHARELAERYANLDPALGDDLLFYWFKRFLSMNTDSLEGNSLVDKFLRTVLRGEVPCRLPESLCTDWPETEQQIANYTPHWPAEEVEFQWAMERDHYYAERAKRAAELEEETRRKAEEANQARLAREQELRDQYLKEKAEFEAENSWSQR